MLGSALRFAEQLYAERDLYRAITEYKRFLFLRPDSPLAGLDVEVPDDSMLTGILLQGRF